jgi:hypothetical protein
MEHRAAVHSNGIQFLSYLFRREADREWWVELRKVRHDGSLFFPMRWGSGDITGCCDGQPVESLSGDSFPFTSHRFACL